jgi:signal transduction histidine kinase
VNSVVPVLGARLSLWRAAVVFRVAALVVCLYLILRWQHVYRHPGQALAVGAAMVLVTGLIGYLGWTGRAHRLPVVAGDLLASVLLTLATRSVQTVGQRHGSMPTLTTIWATGPVVEAAVVTGLAGGIGAALVQIAAAMVVRGGWDGRTLDSAVLLLVSGSVVGYLGRLTVQAEEQTRAMAAVQAATAERQRLARSVHDGALQVLALVHRDGLAAGGRWATLGAAAAEQEAALRRLIATEATRAPHDLAGELTALRTDTVSVVLIGEPVLPDPVADALLGAVGEALRNVARHAGEVAQAWVVYEQSEQAVRITVRDDGIGMADGRLAEAERDSRLGVAGSIRRAVVEVGGSVRITSAPGSGTEIVLEVPLP